MALVYLAIKNKRRFLQKKVKFIIYDYIKLDLIIRDV